MHIIKAAYVKEKFKQKDRSSTIISFEWRAAYF